MERILPPKFWVDASYNPKKKKEISVYRKSTQSSFRNHDAFEVKLDTN